jgi:hypothetical protein
MGNTKDLRDEIAIEAMKIFLKNGLEADRDKQTRIKMQTAPIDYLLQIAEDSYYLANKMIESKKHKENKSSKKKPGSIIDVDLWDK